MVFDTRYPFSAAFGNAETRKACVESSGKVYQRLLRLQDNTGALEFSTLCSVAVNPKDGRLDRDKIKLLKKVFRPNKERELTLVDFTRGIDNVYRELKTLSAAIRNASASKFKFSALPVALDALSKFSHLHMKSIAARSQLTESLNRS